MEQFSLEKYLANPSRKVVTRDGRIARIICTDKRELNYPIIALIETRPGGGEVTYSYTKGGRHCTACADYDLFFAPEKHTGWVNIYKSKYDGYELSQVYQRKEDAIKRGEKTPDYITTTKIEWEE